MILKSCTAAIFAQAVRFQLLHECLERRLSDVVSRSDINVGEQVGFEGVSCRRSPFRYRLSSAIRLTEAKSIATIRGDLSNITAPPFVLADKSTVEFPQYWAENPSIFLAPAFEPDPQKRALLVLKWFLSSLKSQQYAGKSPEAGVKKPLNAFLGELFLGQWDDENGVTRLVSEQVR